MSCIPSESRNESKKPTSKLPGFVKRNLTPAACIWATIRSPPVPVIDRPELGVPFIAASSDLTVDVSARRAHAQRRQSLHERATGDFVADVLLDDLSHDEPPGSKRCE